MVVLEVAPFDVGICVFENSMVIMNGEMDDSSDGRASYVCTAVTGRENSVASNAVIVMVEVSSMSPMSAYMTTYKISFTFNVCMHCIPLNVL